VSRTTYGEDEDYPGQFDLWQANLARSFNGKAGRAALTDLRAALLALPRKRLIANRLAADGDVCTVGALLLVRGHTQEDLEARSGTCVCGHIRDEHEGPCRPCGLRRANTRLKAEAGEWPPVRHMGYFTFPDACNGYRPSPADDDGDDPAESDLTLALAKDAGVPRMIAWYLEAENDDGEYGLGRLSPEHRYERVLADVERRLGLICWCAEDQPCHADVLLELAEGQP